MQAKARAVGMLPALGGVGNERRLSGGCGIAPQGSNRSGEAWPRVDRRDDAGGSDELGHLLTPRLARCD